MRKSVDFKGTILFAVATVVLVLISVFCISGTVMSKSDMEYAELENYYREQEKELLTQTKDVLSQLGYQNSGVTLTRVVDENDNREYTITIHHGKIDKMSVEERVELAEVLASNTEFAGLSLENTASEQDGTGSMLLAECSFSHEFLMYE